VRKSALLALRLLYENSEHQAQLENFTQRFKDRIVEMTSDKDNSVCVEAIKLASLLSKYGSLLFKIDSH
jgi:cohesin complex subunit SA-1/2